MKKTLALIAALVLIAAASNVFAQSTLIATTITTQERDPTFALGRDFWFAPGQNGTDEPGKFIRLYITSPNNTKAYIEWNGYSASVSVSSYTVGTYTVPLAWELKSSGIVENKGIHVYSTDADIAVYLLSFSPQESDGMYCIPTIGWGTSYVVASYESLFESINGSAYDFPSEFTITANRDSTVVLITPSADLRLSTLFPDNDSAVHFPKGHQFSVSLNQGQSVQYQAVLSKDADNYDVSGTAITANYPVGVVGASMCPNIPSNYPYCEYITDMIPPTRSWGKTYYATNYLQPTGLTSHDVSMYLMISSVPNQEIRRYDPTTGDHLEATLGPAGDKYFIEETGPNKFYSSSPFLLVEYMNSESYPDNVNGEGSPSEVVIPARENFAKTATFLTPSSFGSQSPYDNYANLIVRAGDERNVFFDGKSITNYTHEFIDDTFEIYIVEHISGGSAHPITSDSGVGVYAYGYGDGYSYSWGASAKVGTSISSDTTPPVATVYSQCFSSTVHIADSQVGATTLDEIRLDSNENMLYSLDTGWFDGAGFDTTGYSFSVVDDTKPALLVVSAFDYAGNRTTIRSSYTPNIAYITPPLQNFGVGVKTGPRVVAYDTIVNLGQVPFKIETLSLKYGNKGFSIDSADTKDSLKVGERRVIKLSFLSTQPAASVDTVFFGNECVTQTVALIGFSGAPDFFVSDVDWINAPLKAIPAGNYIIKGALIHNLSKVPIHVSNAGWTDHQHFVLIPGSTFPIVLQPYGMPGDTGSAWFYFEPTALGRVAAQASWTAPEVLNEDSSLSIHYDSLIGTAIAPALTFTADTTLNIDCPDTSVHFVEVPFVLSNSGTQDAVINKVYVTNPTQFTNLIGYDQHGFSWDPSTQPIAIPPGAADTFEVDFAVTPNTNTSGTTQIIALDIVGDTIGGAALTATVNISFTEADISSQSLDFGTVPWQGAKVTQTFTITNTSSNSLEIESIGILPVNHIFPSYSFTTSPQLPDTLTTSQTMTVNVIFDPSVSGNPVQNTQLLFDWNACNPSLMNLSASLSGSGVAEESAPQSLASIFQLDDGRSIQVIIPSGWTQPERIDIYNILGETVYTSSLDGTSTFDLGALTRGVYFYRLREGGISQTGKILMGVKQF